MESEPIKFRFSTAGNTFSLFPFIGSLVVSPSIIQEKDNTRIKNNMILINTFLILVSPYLL